MTKVISSIGMICSLTLQWMNCKVNGFTILPHTRTILHQYRHLNDRLVSSSTIPALYLSSKSNSNNSDPFGILNIEPTADKKIIKKAYRRMAMKYHPDVVVNVNSSASEKKQASDNFATINAAYEMLMGKNSDGVSSGSDQQWKSSPQSSSNNYSYSSDQNNNVDWKDFMPKYDDDMYDTNGDSFTSIFSDFVSEVAGANSKGGILKDLVEFLESNVDGFSSGNYNEYDPSIQDLLQNGNMQAVKEELDDTNLLVQQLMKKKADLRIEQETLQQLIMDERNANAPASFVTRMEREERLEEVSARMKVVEGYLTKAKGRLLRLQTRYKELRSNSNGSNNNSNTNYSSNYDANYSASNTKSDPKSTPNEDDWKREGFGSTSRTRGRSRSRRPNTSYSSPPSSPPSNFSKTPTSAPASTQTKKATEDYNVSMTQYQNTPPHRRVSSQAKNVAENKKRLRELQVEDEFEKLKKDLGL